MPAPDKVGGGGPAFPGEQGHIPDGTWNQTWNPGLTVRQYYAAAALTGILANPAAIGKFTKEEIVFGSFGWADALLNHEGKERGELK